MEYLRSYITLPWTAREEYLHSGAGHRAIMTGSCTGEIRQTMTRPLTRVELHSHMDGSVRTETVWELSRAKGLPLPGDGSLRDLQEQVVIRHPVDLAHFLAPFIYLGPPFTDDLVAVERMAFEYIEDKAKDGVAYVEARFAPHTLLTPAVCDMPHLEGVVTAASKGLTRGGEKYGVQWGLLLCTLAGLDTSFEVEQLCERTRNLGVVGIDMASPTCNPSVDEVPADGNEPIAFQRAKAAGLFRTVHAGERGPAAMVERAVKLYGAQRIGHGYHVVDDAAIYAEVKQANIHLECCPYSSYLTGAVSMSTELHPIARFAADEANFSLSTDDPTITGHTLSEDYGLFSSWGLTEAQAVRASLNAASSAFLPETERDRLKQTILKQVIPNL